MISIKNADKLAMIGAFSTLAIASIALARQSKDLRAAAAADKAASQPSIGADQGPAPRSMDFYVQQKRDNLFFAKATAPKPVAASIVVKPVLPPPPIKPGLPLDPGAPPDPFADYTYIGSVTLNGQIQALIENKKTKEGWYVTTGATFQGSPVARVDLRSVTLLVAGQPRLLAKSTEINLSPMNNGAAKPGQPGQPGPGQPGQPGPGQPGRPGPGGPVAGPGGMPEMQAEQAAAMEMAMKAQYEQAVMQINAAPQSLQLDSAAPVSDVMVLKSK